MTGFHGGSRLGLDDSPLRGTRVDSGEGLRRFEEIEGGGKKRHDNADFRWNQAARPTLFAPQVNTATGQ